MTEKNTAKKDWTTSLQRSGQFFYHARFLGLARDVVFARVIGAEALADVFFVAFKIPNFFRRLFAETLLKPLCRFWVSIEKDSVAAVRELVSRVAGNLGLTLIFITLFIVLASPLMAAIFAPIGIWKILASLLLPQRCSHYLSLFIIYLNDRCRWCSTNSYDRFAVPALPLLLNVTLIAAALIGAPLFEQPAYALAWGVLVAGIVQFIFQLPFCGVFICCQCPKWIGSILV